MNRANELLRRFAKARAPSHLKHVAEQGFKPNLDIAFRYADSLTHGPSKAQLTGYLSAMSQRVRDVDTEVKEFLSQKKLPAEIPFGYYYQKANDFKSVAAIHYLYDSIFENEPAIKEFEGYLRNKAKKEEEDYAQRLESAKDAAELDARFEERAREMRWTAENEINPLLNPFADFWIYGVDMPELKEVFAARPQWLEMINKVSDEFAWEFNSKEPTGVERTAEYQEEIRKVIRSIDFDEMDPEQILEDASTGKLDLMLEQRYNQWVQEKEDHFLEHQTHDDLESYALVNPFISKEANPAAKYLAHH